MPADGGDLAPKGLTMPVMGATKVEYAFGSDPDRIKNHPRMFKKHKVLPHPRKDVTGVNDLQRPGSGRSVDTDAPSLRSATSQQSKRPRRKARAPEPPPTPPTHSRTSSGTHHAGDRPGPNGAASPAESTETVDSQQPITPPNQQTPPTPNLTPERSPPGPAARQVKPRPPISERLPSKITIGSRTESWRTAPENPESSDDGELNDQGTSALRSALPSAKTSQSTVRQVNGDSKAKQPQIVGLGLGLESPAQEDVTTPTAQEFKKFDGEWAEGEASLISEVEEEWDQNLGRNVMVRRKRRPITQREGDKQEVVQDSPVTPTMETKASRFISLQESPAVYPRRAVSDRLPAQTAPSASEVSISSDMKRSSIVSTKSTASTVVEAVPQRRKTLRHVRKQSLLRDSCSDLSPSSSAPTSVSATVEDQRRGRSTGYRLGDAARGSQASTATFNSISSRKARKEVLKTGGIPVVIVPERRSSVKSHSRPPSLRSTSSRRSQSVGSAHRSQSSKGKDQHGPVFERPRRHSRTRSESDGSRLGDERTIDFPPVIPTRSSSLSAPTSRNVSRTGSLTADSLRAHNAFQAQQAHQALQNASRELDSLVTAQDIQRTKGQPEITHRRPTVVITGKVSEPPEVVVQYAPANGWRRESDHERGSQDHHEDQGERVNSEYGDPFWGKRLSAQNTPFSVASVETAGTSHAEVSEAMAVNIYPHQSKSVVLVDHAAKPSEGSSISFYRSSDSNTPTIKLTGANGGAPSTPPQQFIGDDVVDSPLRNPRVPPAPPKPPAINFIPATPSGYTPIAEKQHMMGNYFEVAGAEKPKRSLSLLRQTLTRRTTGSSEHGPSASRPLGFLTRTFSLSRSNSSNAPPRLKRSSSTDDRPADESRLHPRWRPAHLDYSSSSCSSDGEDDEEYYRERTYKYPPIDNRPSSRYHTSQSPRRSLSARLKRTFAILPQQPDQHDYYDDEGPERRTIRRTPSGNLRVMKFRRSMESLRRIELVDNGPVPARPITAPEGQSGSRAGRFFERKLPGGLVRSLSLGRSKTLPTTSTTGYGYGGGNVDDRPTFGDRINIPRRLSERRREKRTQELRKMISGPREVRDGVGEVIKRNSWGTRGVNHGEVGGRNVVRRRGLYV
ncbi:hypothetical protein QBC44DRAFT_329065 [Cladorrhinum sp. PSN332]|nr:hypothetical protein QBC44DRAFT_329065 [Cladorrhinum sp. PSN332]